MLASAASTDLIYVGCQASIRGCQREWFSGFPICLVEDQIEPNTLLRMGHNNKEEQQMDNKDIKISLLYNLDEVNVLLTLLGSLPFNQSAQMIANIRDQALPQLPVASEQSTGTD